MRVIIGETFDADGYVFEAWRAGASGFLVKDTEPEDLIEAVRVAACGLDPELVRGLVGRGWPDA